MGPKTLALKQLCQSLGRRYVGFRGDPRSPIWLVGEAPGADEDQLGISFVGSSGRELDRMLEEAGIPPSMCCFVNLYKVRPPENDISRIAEFGIKPEVFVEQFYEELREYRPTFICPVGATALQILCGFTIDPRDHETKISKWRGSILVSEELRWSHYVIPNFHPAYILREWSDRDVSVFIFRRVKEEFDFWSRNARLQPLPSRELIADPSFGEAKDYLQECLSHDGPTSSDIELLARKVPICISFSFNRSSAVSISLFDGEPSNLRVLWQLINKIYSTKRLVGQNWTTFDANWVEALGFNSGVERCDDTLVRHHVLHPELSHKLDFQGMQYTRQPFWKDDGKGWQLREGFTKLKRYNCLDAAVTLEIFYEQEKEFAEASGLCIQKDNLIHNTIHHGETKSIKNIPSLLDAGFGKMGSMVEQKSGLMENQNGSIESYTKRSMDQYLKDISSTTNAESNLVSIPTIAKSQQEKTILENYMKSAETTKDRLKGFANLYEFYSQYEMPLARAFHSIDKRGIQTDSQELEKMRREIVAELGSKCFDIAQNLKGRPVAYSQEMAQKLGKELGVDSKLVLNIASVPQLKEVLTNELHIKLKKDRYSGKESTGEESLNEAFAATGNPVLKSILRTRELNKMLGTYVNAKLDNGVFYSCYSVTGTVTGRRASRANFLGYGSNGQNQPKHSDLGEKFQGIYIARPGCIYVACDQASAEEWVVQGIIADVSGDTKGIQELQDSISTGISRHARLASAIFGLPLERTNNKECLEYYVGKKVRHAGNYDMREDKMAVVMAAEGFPTNKQFCAAILNKFHEVEPNIRNVFHRYIQHELTTTRTLRTPLGRERVFHSLRPHGDNSKIFREGYAYIPQSSIGDNNGLAVLYCQTHRPGIVLADGHDSMLNEARDNLDDVIAVMRLMEQAYDRVLTFPNGFKVRIPIDFRIGYSMKGLKKCPGPLSETGLQNISKTYLQLQSLRHSTTSGAQQAASQQPLNETLGLSEKSTNSIQTSTSSLSDVQG